MRARHLSLILWVCMLTTCVLSGCGPVRIVVDRRAPDFNRKSLETRGAILFVVADDLTQHDYPDITQAVMNTVIAELAPAPVSSSREALRVAAEGNVEEDARRIAQSLHRRQSFDHAWHAAVAPLWREAFGARYIVVVSVGDPDTYSYLETSTHNETDEFGNVVKSTTTKRWVSGTKIAIRLFAVPVDRPTVVWRIYAEGNFEHRSADRLAEAIVQSLIDSLFDDTKPRSVQNYARETVKRMLAALD